MGLSYNDISTLAWTKYNGTASANNIFSATGSVRIMMIRLIPAAAAATLLLANATTVTGTDLLHLAAAANGTSDTVTFGPRGVKWSAVSTTLGGAGALYEIYYVEA